jgi:hypothetical protein
VPLAAVGLVAWVSALTAAPYLPLPAAGLLYLFGSRICHQIAVRSLHIGEAQLPVCARCYGIYAGAALVGTIWACATRVAPERWGGRWLPRVNVAYVVAPAVIFNVITIAAEWMRLWMPSNPIRASAGGTLGAAAALAIAVGVSKLDYTQWTSTRSLSRDRHATRI